MKFKLCILIFLFCAVNLQLSSSLKCQFLDDDRKFLGYVCEVKLDSKSVTEEHLPNKTDDKVVSIEVDEDSRIKHLLSSEFTFCQRFLMVNRIDIKNVKSIDENLFNDCQNLKSIHIRESNIREYPEEIFSRNLNLEEISLGDSTFSTLPENIFKNQQKLTELDLSSNRINFLPPNIFKPLKNLEWLGMTGNEIQVIDPAWFEPLMSLKTLYLNRNEILELPINAFSSLINLKHLSLAENYLTVIHADSFGVDPKLEDMDFKDNRIEEIDAKLIEKAPKSKVNMEKNICCTDNVKYPNAVKIKLEICFRNYEPRQ